MSNTKIDWNISSLKTSNYTITEKVGFFVDPIYQDIKVTLISWVEE